SEAGAPMEGGLALEAVRAACAAPNLSFRGLHAHIGSQVLSELPYARTIEVLFDLVRSILDEVGATVDVLDVGGGFGVRYVDEEPLPVADVAESIMANIAEAAAARGVDGPEGIVDPGGPGGAKAAG